MSPPLFLLVLLSFQPARAGEPGLAWLAPAPSQRAEERARRACGEGEELSLAVLRFPAADFSGMDEDYDELARLLDEARGRWEAFDVEQGIVYDLGAAIERLRGVRSEQDRELLLSALLLQGAALYWAEPPGRRGQAPFSRELYRELDGEPANGPWMDALALAGEERPITREDFPDLGSFEAFQALEQRWRGALQGSLLLGGLEELGDEAVLVLDGRRVEAPGAVLRLRPGRYWLHLLVDGEPRGAAVLLVQGGDRIELPAAFGEEELEQARRAVQRGRGSLPPELRAALEREGAGEATCLAVPRGAGAAVARLEQLEGEAPSPWNLLLGADFGAGIALSPTFEPGDGTFLPSLGGQGTLSWRSLALRGTLDLQYTPGQHVTYGSAEAGVNRQTSLLARIDLGLGLYVLQPHPGRAYLLLGWQGGVVTPAHHGKGPYWEWGIPTGDRWLFLASEFWYGEPFEGYEGRMTQVDFRLGLAFPRS